MTRGATAKRRKARAAYESGLATIAPHNALLVHACNCVGRWGTGVATALARRFPSLVATRQKYIRDNPVEKLLGTCIIVWAGEKSLARTQWIARWLTSKGYRKRTKDHPGRSSADNIVKYTKMALEDLRRQLEYYRDLKPDSGESKPDVNKLWACEFNGGFFDVKCAVTLEMLQEVFAGWDGEMKIVSPD